MLCADAACGELGLRGHGRLAAVVPHPGDVLLLSESGFCGVRAFSPVRSSSRRRRESRTPRGDRHRRCVQPTHSRAAFACTAHSRPPRATHLRGPARAGRRGSSRSAATERRRASLPACEWDVRGGGVMGASSVPSPAWQVVMPQRGVQMGQDWNTVSFGTRPQSAASSHQKQQTLRDAQRTGGQIETTAKHGGGKNGGLSAAAVEANRLDADTGEGSRAPKPRPPASLHRICAPSPRSGTRGG